MARMGKRALAALEVARADAAGRAAVQRVTGRSI